jgi:hypothetical protein
MGDCVARQIVGAASQAGSSFVGRFKRHSRGTDVGERREGGLSELSAPAFGLEPTYGW